MTRKTFEIGKNIFAIFGIMSFIGIVLGGTIFKNKNNNNQSYNDVLKQNSEAKIKENKTKKTNEDVENNIETKKTSKDESKKEYTFKNGNFICGKDFTQATYDIVAIEGGGNISCRENGFSAIMGVESRNKQGSINIYQKEYKNIEFKKGDKLKVDRVTIKLIKK